MNEKMNSRDHQSKGGESGLDRPGRISGTAHIKIQTRQAQRLVYGRRKSGDKNQIIGMLQFGFFVQKIWSAASIDDPYADWFLLRIHDALERGREEMGGMRKAVDEQLKMLQSVRIEIAQSVEPILIPIQFPNPYGYMGAYLIADFDDLCIALLTARHFGLLDRETVEKQLARASSVVRRTFMSSAGWKPVGIIRADFFVPTADSKARIDKAVELMGQCPPKALDGSLRSAMAPQIHRSSVDLAKRKEEERKDDKPKKEKAKPKQYSKPKIVTKKAKNLAVITPEPERSEPEVAVS